MMAADAMRVSRCASYASRRPTVGDLPIAPGISPVTLAGRGVLLGWWNKKAARWCGRLLSLAALGTLPSCSARSAAVTPAAQPLAPPAYQQPFTIPRFDWPITQGMLSSGFGLRHGAMHEGIDIAAPVG